MDLLSCLLCVNACLSSPPCGHEGWAAFLSGPEEHRQGRSVCWDGVCRSGTVRAAGTRHTLGGGMKPDQDRRPGSGGGGRADPDAGQGHCQVPKGSPRPWWVGGTKGSLEPHTMRKQACSGRAERGLQGTRAGAVGQHKCPDWREKVHWGPHGLLHEGGRKRTET